MSSTKGNVVFVLLLVQVATILLATVGELLFMSGLFFYALVPLARVTLLIVFGALALRGHRASLIALIVLQTLSLLGFALSIAVGLLPAADFTPTLTGLFTTAVLPIIIIVYCAQLLTRPKEVAAA